MFKHHLELTVLLTYVVLCSGCASPATKTSVSLTATPLPASTITPSQPPPTHTPTNTPIPTPPLTGPYLGQEPPGMQPKIFAPGVISDPTAGEYSGTFSPDGSEYYFYRFSDDSQARILFSKIVDGIWTEPEEVSFSTGYAAFEPYIGFDNQRLYFAWAKPVPSGVTGLPAYFFVERTTDGWSEPEYAGQGMFVSSSRDGQFYTTDMSSRSKNGTTYLAKIIMNEGVFTSYERLEIRSQRGFQAHPCIAHDGSYILFDVESGHHLYISFKNTDGTWGEAIDLTQHGFDQKAGGAYISPDGKYLFFALNRDIWWVDIRVVEDLRPKEGE